MPFYLYLCCTRKLHTTKPKHCSLKYCLKMNHYWFHILYMFQKGFLALPCLDRGFQWEYQPPPCAHTSLGQSPRLDHEGSSHAVSPGRSQPCPQWPGLTWNPAWPDQGQDLQLHLRVHMVLFSGLVLWTLKPFQLFSSRGFKIYI